MVAGPSARDPYFEPWRSPIWKWALSTSVVVAAGVIGFYLGSMRPAATANLIPDQPDAVAVALYRPTAGSPPGPPERIVSVSDSKQVAKLLTDANNLPRVPKGSYSCPADDGSYYQLQFSYSNGDRLTIYAERGGCEVVGYANHPDYSPAWSLTDHRLLSDLDALFR